MSTRAKSAINSVEATISSDDSPTPYQRVGTIDGGNHGKGDGAFLPPSIVPDALMGVGNQ